jgi:GNAT superfamily N-acetyltransferase
MMYRYLDSGEVHKIEELARQFLIDSEFAEYDMSHMRGFWQSAIDNGIGAIFAAIDCSKVIGGIGMLRHPDIHCGKMTAVEAFWIVLKEYRKSNIGIKLLREFETWADRNGCKRKGLIHLSDSMPEKLKHLYESMGYRLLESHYIKES